MPEGQPQRLESWKAIAHYLGRDVSTVARWARRWGLPVHRVPAGKRGSVFAYRGELDAWLLGPGDAARREGRRSRRPISWLIGGITVVLALGSGGLVMVRATRPGPVARISFSGSTLSAWDERGRLSWTYAFASDVREASSSDFRRPVQLADLDGDGEAEALVVAAFPKGGDDEIPEQELYCFSGRGQLRWRYRPQLTLTFGGRRWDGPWQVTDLLVAPEGRSQAVWVAFAHHTWWPAFVARLDAGGRARVALTHSGVIYALNYLRTSAHTYVLAGGVNNEYDAGSLAVLETDQQPAVSPQVLGSPYHCETCAQGATYRYFVFPRSELNRELALPYNVGRLIRVHDRGIQVGTHEVQTPPFDAWAFFELSDTFDLENVAYGDGYWPLHAKLEREGKLDHTAETCPERTKPKMARRWDSERGWTDVPVRLVATPR